MNEHHLAYASIDEIGALFRKRKLSPLELTHSMLARIQRINPQLNAYITVTAELALRQAKRAEGELFARRGSGASRTRRDRGPLHGVPISLKDNIHTAAIRTTAGSQILQDFVPQRDARVVQQLQQAGAVILGKNNMHEFAYGVTNNNPHYGPARNPWHTSRISGGSSGGSAVAVAAGLCYGSVGTDTGGSIRIPAALCGIIGLKPSAGKVSADGVIPLSPMLDCVGPLARTAQDAARLLQVISGCSPVKRSATKLNRVRLGVPNEFFFEVISQEVRTAFEVALDALRKDGAQIEQISLPLLNETEDAGNQIAWAEATHYHQQSGWYPARAAEYGEDVRSRLQMGTRVLATQFLEALEMRDKFVQQLGGAMANAKLDALVVPTTPIAAPLVEEETTNVGGRDYPTRALLLRLNRPANLAGVPALSVPIGTNSTGLPIGLQLIGKVSSENLLLRTAQSIEEANPPRNTPIP
ncbi:MAG: Asp-tRNA(Asn)/Glu-tRNA(Gln) amidotransferase GatCAB subunit A [Candidatus Acidiferrum sp.]